jgi:hypothetical protein
MENLRKHIKNRIHDSWYVERGSIRAPAKHKFRDLLLMKPMPY